MVCVLSLGPLKQVGTLAEVKAFGKKWLKAFPEDTYRIYRLEEVKGCSVLIVNGWQRQRGLENGDGKVYDGAIRQRNL